MRSGVPQNVRSELENLKQIHLPEELKNCIYSKIRTCLEEQTVETLEQAASAAIDYALTYSTENDYVSIKGVSRWIRYFKGKQSHY